jgi:hypothetical protein
MVMSTTAHASGGSNGSKLEGKLDSVTCVWDRSYFQTNRFAPQPPQHDYSADSLCEINVGRGWQVLSRNEQFTIPFGQVLQFRPFRSHSGGRSAELPNDGTTTTSVPTTSPPTTSEPTTTSPEPLANADVVTSPPPTAVDTTAPSITEPPPSDPTTTVAAPTTSEDPAPPDTSVAPEIVEPIGTGAVDTIVIDMSGRTDINVGDVYGFFRIVDAEPA